MSVKTGLSGIGGTLFPSRYLSDRVLSDAGTAADVKSAALEHRRRQMLRWWRTAAGCCGPASGLRALFDLVAMPLFGMLGYRAHDAIFEQQQARARLATRGGSTVGLVLVPWASRPPGIWRDLFHVSRDLGATWCFVLAPPFLSLVDVRGRATRRSLDFGLPAVLDAGSFPYFWTLARATTLEPSRFTGTGVCTPSTLRPMDSLLGLAGRYQDRVRNDLQEGVQTALDVLATAARTSRDEALVIVYRILFLLFVEARDLVPRGHPIYARAYSVGQLVKDVLGDRGGRGAWDALAAITRLSRLGCRTDDLFVQPFNGRLFARRSAPSLEGRLARQGFRRRAADQDDAMCRSIRALGSRQGSSGREEISYADLGVEQLGAVYERVLDLEPGRRPMDGQHSVLRKQTGTFYTPQPLAEFVVRRTLAPLVAGATADRILSLRVVDPAMGSGAFLVATCRYLAQAYERALINEGRLSATDVDEDGRGSMRRLIAERCLAGVDVNPVAVQLARLSLWLTSLAHGRPLTFLDHRLRVGNSLIGARPEDLWRISDRRRRDREPLPLFGDLDLEQSMRDIVRPFAELAVRADDTIADVRAKEALWERLTRSTSPLGTWRLAIDTWCARWFPADAARPMAPAEIRALIDALIRRDRTLPPDHLSRRFAEARDASRRHGFFHWPLEFCDVFHDEAGRTKNAPGFDAVVGNPPWEVLRSDQAQLTHFVRESGIYRTCGRGHLNLYQPFFERALSICRRGGRIGLVVPWGIAVDDGAATLRKRLVDDGELETLVGLDNAQGLFPIHRGVRFAVVVASPGRQASDIRARFGVRTNEDIDALPGRDDAGHTAYPIRFTADRLRRVGGPARRIPDVRHEADLILLERLLGNFPGLGSAQGWGGRFSRELNASDDRESFGRSGLPVLEGKHLEPFVANVAAARLRILPRDAARLLPDGRYLRPRLAYRDVSGVGNKRSLIAAVLPPAVVTTHTVFCLRTPVSLEASHFLCGILNSFVINAVVRMLMGGHVTTSLAERLPIPPWMGSERQRRIARLARWLSRGRRSMHLEARLQAEVAATYDISAEEFERVASGFPLVSEELRELSTSELRGIYGR